MAVPWFQLAPTAVLWVQVWHQRRCQRVLQDAQTTVVPLARMVAVHNRVAMAAMLEQLAHTNWMGTAMETLAAAPVLLQSWA